MLCFEGLKTLETNSNLTCNSKNFKTLWKDGLWARYQVRVLDPIGLVIFFF